MRVWLSGPKFAALCGVKYQTFATWLQRRKRHRHAYPKRKPQRATAVRVQWLEASVRPAAPSTVTGLLLHLPGGARAGISNEQQAGLAASLVRILEKE
jgi:hypothetical protein